jgi:multimeric flavodoxin WrbA
MGMIKITAVIASPKVTNSNTANIARLFLENLKKLNNDIHYEIIVLSSKKIRMCTGCIVCEKTGACVIDDDLKEIQHKLLESDLIVFGTPVYCWNVSAQYKAFIDRQIIWIHTLRLIGKPAVTVSTTAIDGFNAMQKYLDSTLYMLGMIPIGKIQWVVPHGQSDINEVAFLERYSRLTKKVLNYFQKRKMNPKLMNYFYYFGIVNKMRKSSRHPFDTQYLREKGWFSKNYKQAMIAEQKLVRTRDSYSPTPQHS